MLVTISNSFYKINAIGQVLNRDAGFRPTCNFSVNCLPECIQNRDLDILTRFNSKAACVRIWIHTEDQRCLSIRFDRRTIVRSLCDHSSIYTAVNICSGYRIGFST